MKDFIEQMDIEQWIKSGQIKDIGTGNGIAQSLMNDCVWL